MALSLGSVTLGLQLTCPFISMAVEDAGDGGLGKLGEASDLEGREFAATEGEDAGDPKRVGSFGGTFGTRTAIKETC